MKIKCSAVVLDLWDTVFFHGLNEHPMIQSKQLLVKAGANPSDVFQAMHRTLMLTDFGENKIDFNELCSVLGIAHTPKLEKDLIKIWEQGAEETKFFEDVIPTLSKLKKKFKLGLVSNTTSYKMHYLVEKFELGKLFDAMLFSFDAGVAKPDKKAFELVAQKLKISPQNCVFVGDQLAQDIFGSSAAGMKPILIDRGKKYNEKPKEAVALIHDLRELLDLLEKGD